MRKKLFMTFSLLFLLFSVACSEEEVETPNDHFEHFTQLWTEQNFSELFQRVSTKAKDEYGSEGFIERYEKVYNDLKISDLEITYEILDEEEIEIAFEEGQAAFPFSVSMDSIAGEITFDYEAKILLKELEESIDWLVDWDPGFIFPELKNGGEIRIQTDIPSRGEIIDRNNMPLAINDYIYEVGVVPGDLEENPDEQKEQIASLLNMSVESIDSELNANWVQPDLFVPLKSILKSEDKTAKKLRDIKAVQIRETIGRVYPLGESAAHLIGYIGPVTAEELEKHEDEHYGPHDVIGKRGLEQIFEKRLKGERGIEIIAVTDDDERQVIAKQEAKDGETIQLTIDVNIQEEIYQSYEKEAGTATAIQPKTGEVLAIVSSPAFDPNEFVYDMNSKKLSDLENDPQQPLINRFTATFAPGSVIKPIIGAIGLHNETIDPEEGIEIKGLTWDNGEGWGDYQVRRVSGTDKPVDLADALIRSDNIYFAMKAVEMGSSQLIEGLEQFGFTESIPFAYPITRSPISNDNKLAGEVAVANTSYGQAQIEMSSLHLATTYTAIVNDGQMIKPTLLTEDIDEDYWKEDLLTPEQAKIIKKALRDVVRKGTARVADIDDLEISGKTGTAELKSSLDAKGHENGWFVGYPTEEENLLIAMMIEKVEDKGTSTLVADKVAQLLIEFHDDL